MTDENVKRRVYTALSGFEVPIKPISPTKIMKAEQGLEKAFRDRGEPIDIPIYKVETAGGGSEEFELDIDSIQLPDDPEETAKRQKDWDLYQDAISRLKKEQFDITRIITLDAIDLPLPEDTSWIQEQKDLYIEIPENRHDLWMHWLETEILHPSDVVNLVAEILILSSTGIISEEEVKAAVGLFRSTVSSQPEESGEREDSPGEDAEEEGSLGPQPVDAGGDGGESLGIDTE